MVAEVGMPPGRLQPGGREDGFHIRRLPCPDLNQHVPLRRQMRANTTGERTITIKTVCTAYKRQTGVEVPHIGAQASHVAVWNIGRI